MEPASIVALIVGSAACVTDLRSRRIPNALTFGATVAALAYHVIARSSAGLMVGLLGWFTGIALLLVPFALRGMGGGDVKLMGAIGAWLGPHAAVWVALYAGVIGGVLALVAALLTGYLRTALKNIWLLICHWRVAGLRSFDSLTLATSTGPRLAFAVPLFLGTAAAIWLHP